MKPLTEQDILSAVREEMKGLDEVRLYYVCRQFRLYRNQLKYVKCVLALHKLKLPITSYTVEETLGVTKDTALSSLHNLGDKHILILRREGALPLRWIVNPYFAERAGLQ